MASNCITRTPIRWPRFFRAPTRGPMGTVEHGEWMRLPLEVFQRVAGRSAEIFGGCRYLADECPAGGSDVDDAVYFGVAFTRAGMDFISTSRGGKFDDAKQPAVGWAAYPYTGPSGYECMPQLISDARGPFGRNIAATAAIRKAIRAAGHTTPIICTGGVHNFEMAENMLKADTCDIVGLPGNRWPIPIGFEKFSSVAAPKSVFANSLNYCEGLDQKHKSVTCQLWDKPRSVRTSNLRSTASAD